MLSGGKQAVRRLKRAQILLASDLGQAEQAVASAIGVGVSTVYRTRRRFVEGNLEGGLERGATARQSAQVIEE
jgi:transposase